MGYEAISEQAQCWEVAVRDSNMGARGKYVCFVAALDFARSGRVDLGAKEDWVKHLSKGTGFPPKDVEKAIEEAKKAGFLTVVRHRADDGGYSIYSIRQSRPRQDGMGDVQVFVSKSAATLEDDVRVAMQTDTKERQLQAVMAWE